MRGDKIEKHKVIDVWERHNFDDDLAFSISKKLSEKMKLLNIAEEMESRLMLNQGGIMTERLVSQDTTISTLSVVSQMTKSGEKLLNDMIFFMTLCP